MSELPRNKHIVRIVLQIIIVGGFLVGGAGIMHVLIQAKKIPQKQETPHMGPLVDVTNVTRQDVRMVVEGFGTVQPKVSVQIVPEVGGKIVYLHPNLVNGGFFRADETLVRIDRRDYELAVQRAQAGVAGAQVALDQERAEAAVARTEWMQLHPDTEPTSPLVLRVPQIRKAEAELAAAEAELEAAQLNLARTEISLPYDGRVTAKQVDVGQFVQPGTVLAAVYGTEVVEITVPLEQRDFAWFALPQEASKAQASNPGTVGAEVRVTFQYAGSEHERIGRVVRTDAEVSRTSRMLGVVVEVEKPFDLTRSDAPLVPGQFVTAHIQGRLLQDVVPVPSYALREGDHVWIMQDDTLRIKPVRIARRTRDTIYVTEGLPDKASIVLTNLEVVSDGMKIRVSPGRMSESSATELTTARAGDATLLTVSGN